MHRTLRWMACLIALAALGVACTGETVPTLSSTQARLVAPTATPDSTAAGVAAPAAVLTVGPTLEATSASLLAGTPTFTPPPVPQPMATPTSIPFDPSQVELELAEVLTGLDAPLFVTHAADGSGHLFIVEKGGVIQIAAGNELREQPFLDITDRVGSSASEQGLLGLAFHPGFGENGRFFLYYTDGNGDTVIASYLANKDRTAGDPQSEVVLLTVAQPAGNHNGGMLAFGPDGYLYAGLGDGGAANDRYENGQNRASLLGAILRIDVTDSHRYVVPGDNPFVDVAGARPEIWSYGLRNPWRFSFDRLTGDLLIGDVGQNSWEEINFQAAGSPGGENYGWPIMEGNHCFGEDECDSDGLVLPATDYPHSQGCSVTGGYVYRGRAQPSLAGAYFYGDYCTGRIWALSRGIDGQWQSVELADTDLQISSFGETEDGQVLVVDYGGSVYRVTDR
ncbi:MAG: PQQ-dependent sugar dehydrogenase [Chloroflexota bacterium]|nr:PQQ-dependent sugar dehydrogenase [Chloroflexota bacterium]